MNKVTPFDSLAPVSYTLKTGVAPCVILGADERKLQENQKMTQQILI